LCPLFRGKIIVLFFSGTIGKVRKEITKLGLRDILKNKYKYSIHSKKGFRHRDIYKSLIAEIRKYATELVMSISQDKAGTSI